MSRIDETIDKYITKNKVKKLTGQEDGVATFNVIIEFLKEEFCEEFSEAEYDKAGKKLMDVLKAKKIVFKYDYPRYKDPMKGNFSIHLISDTSERTVRKIIQDTLGKYAEYITVY